MPQIIEVARYRTGIYYRTTSAKHTFRPAMMCPELLKLIFFLELVVAPASKILFQSEPNRA